MYGRLAPVGNGGRITIVGRVTEIVTIPGSPAETWFWGLIKFPEVPETYELKIEFDAEESRRAVQGVVMHDRNSDRGFQVPPPKRMTHQCGGDLPFKDCKVSSSVLVEFKVANRGEQAFLGAPPLQAWRISSIAV